MAKWATVAVLGLLLAGCGGSPTAPVPAEGEKKVALKRATGSATPAAAVTPAARTTATPPASASAAPAVAAAPAAQAPRLADAASKAAVTPAGAAGDAPKAGEPAAPAATPALTVLAAPVGVRVFPVQLGDGRLADMRFDPADGMARWKVKATGGPLRLARVGLEVKGPPGTPPATTEVAGADLRWPAQLSGEAELALPLKLRVLADVVGVAGVKACTLRATPLDGEGAPWRDPDGSPVVLTLAMDVQ